MRSLYVSQQGCSLSLKQEQIVVQRGQAVLDTVQLPLLDQIVIFGQSQVTTPVIRTCLQRDIPILYLSRLGYCYGRVLSIERRYRYLARHQQMLSPSEQLGVACAIVQAKLKNSRVLLLRQQRRQPTEGIAQSIQQLQYLAEQVPHTTAIDRLMGLEGVGAASYFRAFGDCLSPPEFVFTARTRRPPGNPVNALLSFGYQVLWTHLLTLIEVQGLDPYFGCLHQDNDRHATLVSDLLEEFRAAIVDSLVLYLVNRRIVDVNQDFEYRDGGCFLNESGRKKYLRVFVQRMEEMLTINERQQPRWELLHQQVKAFRQFVYNPMVGYQPYVIR